MNFNKLDEDDITIQTELKGIDEEEYHNLKLQPAKIDGEKKECKCCCCCCPKVIRQKFRSLLCCSNPFENSIIIISIVLMFTIMGLLSYISIDERYLKGRDFYMEAIKGHLNELQKIGLKYHSRTAATGFNASGDYIISQLDPDLFSIKKQHFPIPHYTQLEQPQLKRGGNIYSRGKDFQIMDGFDGEVELTKPLNLIKNYGCNETDYDEFQSGSIALIKRGPCSFSLKSKLSKQFGAVATIVYNKDDNLFTGVLNRTSVPIFLLSYSVAKEWLKDLSEPVYLLNKAKHEFKWTYNIIAERRGISDDVIVIGSHLDSVSAGPGINDNGSGSATILEIARILFTFTNRTPRNTIRFIWFAGEEGGLLGSTHYVDNLIEDELKRIVMMLNFDMLASPNGYRAIYDGKNAEDEKIRNGSALIQEKFQEYFKMKGLKTQLTPFDGRSDYGRFIEMGKPAGGLFSGAEEYKTMKERSEVFGLAGVAYDPCYHNACDDYYNLNFQLLKEMAEAVKSIIGFFANEIQLRKKMGLPK